MSTLPDLLRLVAVPVLGWAAYRDLRTRRVPNAIWWPLALLGFVLLLWEARTLTGNPAFPVWATRVLLSVGIVVPLSYGFWYVGGFGGADAKAFMALAVLLPTFPTYRVGSTLLPVVSTDVGVFSLTVLTNTVLVALAYPLALAARNLLDGEVSWVAFLGRPTPVDRVPTTHGSLLETPDGLTRNGLDLDALRMYLRWRGVSLADLRKNPSLRDPATLPAEPNDPTDGAIETDGSGDPWGAGAFLDDVESAYGTSPEQLRAGLEVLVSAEDVWVTPGIPFLVPTFVGLLVALSAGDLLFVGLSTLGLV